MVDIRDETASFRGGVFNVNGGWIGKISWKCFEVMVIVTVRKKDQHREGNLEKVRFTSMIRFTII